MNDELTVEASHVDGHDVLAVTGELDLATAPVLQEAVESVLADDRARLILDLSGVSFLDSAGLRVLVAAHRSLQEQRRTLRIACTTSRVRAVFRVASLNEVFSVFDTVADAVAAGE